MGGWDRPTGGAGFVTEPAAGGPIPEGWTRTGTMSRPAEGFRRASAARKLRGYASVTEALDPWFASSLDELKNPERSSSTAPTVMHESATLKVGKCQSQAVK